MPSFLDVLGTIVDTSGLYYVINPIILDKRFCESDAQRFCLVLYLYHHNFLSEEKTPTQKAFTYDCHPRISDFNWSFKHQQSQQCKV